MATRSQTITVNCPACRQPFATETHRVIDVKDTPDLKWQLLSGKVNVAVCTHCGMGGILGMPFAYHDPEKKLLLVFVPNEAGLTANDQQKLIGSLTQDVMNSLPPAERKSYLFSPQTFILLDSLVNAILRADGITEEMIEAQEKRSQLINDMLRVMDDEEKLAEMAGEHADQIDYEFFQTLTATAGAAAEDQKSELADSLLTLRATLLKLQAPAAPPAAQPGPDASGSAITREQLVQYLREAENDEEFEALVAAGRPIIDYSFYLHIANQIEAAEGDGRRDEARELTALRDRILDLAAEMDREAQEALTAANDLLDELMKTDDLSTAIEAKIDQINDVFFYILTANIDHLSRDDAEKHAERIEKLQAIAERAGDALERRMPPELRLINRLLRAETDAERDRALTAEAALVNKDMLATIDALIGQFAATGQSPIGKQLAELRELVALRLADPSDEAAE